MVNTKEIPPEAILLGVYLELQNGQRSLILPVFLLKTGVYLYK